MIEIDILSLILAPENLSILLYYFIPGYLFFAFIKYKELYPFREKWKIISGLDMIIFSIVLSIIFSLNFVLIFHAFIGLSVGVLSALGLLVVQLPIQFFEKYKLYKAEYPYLAALCIIVTFYSEISYQVAPPSYLRLLSPTIGLFFFLVVFKILRFKLYETIRPESKNEIGFW
jgi:hypothetical protein